MDCDTLGPMISALYDGENVPPETARHIANCENCRQKLADYLAMAVEIRLFAAQEREVGNPPAVAKRPALPTRSSIGVALRKRMQVPRFAAAICGLAIIVLAGGWARTRAQMPAQWFQYKVSFGGNGEGGNVGGIERACNSPCARPFMISPGGQHIGMLLQVRDIEGDHVYITLSSKQFANPPQVKNLSREMSDAPAAQYIYKLGNVLQIPVAGGSDVKLEGIVAASSEGVPLWFDRPVQPKENEIAVRKGVLIRDGRVIAEMVGSASATGDANTSPGFFAYIPQHGLFAIGLRPFSDATEGTVDNSQIQFEENGVKYMLLSASPITGGSQPRQVWILHLPDYRPSQHESQSEKGASTPWSDTSQRVGSSSNITAMLKQMGAIPN